MKTFEGKNLEAALEEASNELGIDKSALSYEIIKEEKRLFSKKVVIEVYETTDIIDYLVDYLERLITSFGIECEIKPSLRDNVIRLEINTDHNAILIGNNGRTLSALNDIVRLAATTKFKRRVRVLLDINKYKSAKYRRIVIDAKKSARQVLKTHEPIELEPMPSDERRAIHNGLAKMKNIKTESTGTGRDRKIVISYVESN